MTTNASYFYSMVSFIVISTVIILVYIFLSLYMKKILAKMDNLENTLSSLERKKNKK